MFVLAASNSVVVNSWLTTSSGYPYFIQQGHFDVTNYRQSHIRLASNTRRASNIMPKGVKKENLPTKICVVCERPFTWRKKWERCWDEVTTCSKSCNRKRRAKAKTQKTDVVATPGTEEQAKQHATEHDSQCSSDCDENDVYEMIRTELRLIDPTSDETAVSTTESGAEHETVSADSGRNGDTSSDEETSSIQAIDDPKERSKAERKAAKKAKKAARRAQREGRGDPTAGQKPCDMCGKSVNLLIRCTYDASGEWKMVCGKCWNVASGGVVDGDVNHPHYRYGGLWKNRRQR